MLVVLPLGYIWGLGIPWRGSGGLVLLQASPTRQLRPRLGTWDSHQDRPRENAPELLPGFCQVGRPCGGGDVDQVVISGVWLLCPERWKQPEQGEPPRLMCVLPAAGWQHAPALRLPSESSGESSKTLPSSRLGPALLPTL